MNHACVRQGIRLLTVFDVVSMTLVEEEMRKSTFDWSAIALMIGVAALFRVVPHPANVTPLTALCLFVGAGVESLVGGVLVVFATMFLSDLFIGLHNEMLFVYGSYALIVAIGWVARRAGGKGSAIVVATLSSSLLFFVVTNFGAWLVSGIYPHDATGFIDCYIMALPFLRNALLGDLLFVGVVFSALAALERRGMVRAKA